MGGSDREETRRRAAGASLAAGVVIPAHPLALDAKGRLDERRQRALSRYYLAAGAGGLAVGVHTTQFQIHDPKIGLLEPVLALAAEEMNRADERRQTPLVRVAGLCGDTRQAVAEARLAREFGYLYGLVSLASFRGKPWRDMIAHLQAVAEVLSVFAFYLQPLVGGVDLPYGFWRSLCELENVVAVKVAAFNRYGAVDVVRAVAESGREDIALYTGNDDNIVPDLVTPYRFDVGGSTSVRRFVGGLLGQWAVWTQKAVVLHERCRELAASDAEAPAELLRYGAELTDANGAIFDSPNGFRGCIPGIHEVLRRQGLLAVARCLREDETLSPGQALEIERVCRAYPHLGDDEFVSEHLDAWLSG